MFVYEFELCSLCGGQLDEHGICRQCFIKSEEGIVKPVYYCSHCMRPIEEDGICPYCGYDHEETGNTSPALERGTLLQERYQLGADIGQGGFGITYAAWDERLRCPVAIKEYYPREFVQRNTEYSDQVQVVKEHENIYQHGLKQFLQEARVLAMLKDVAGVVTVQDHFEENGTAYIVMEYLHGVTLKEAMRSEAINAKTLLKRMLDPINALIALHKQGIMHCDIKPDNVMVLDDGRMKLIDFGSSVRMNYRQTIYFGTAGYAALEQCEHHPYGIGPWTDVYGICATIYETLSGEAPPSAVLRVISDHIKPFKRRGTGASKRQQNTIMRGLAIQPDKRMQSMDELRALLYNMPLPEEARRHRMMMRRASVLVGVTLVTALAVVVNITVGLPLGEGLIYRLYLNGWHIVDEVESQENRTIPSSRLGIPVVGIEKHAFSDSDAMLSVTVPGSIRQIGEFAFSDCDNLKNAVLQPGVEDLGDFAFYQCPSLHTVQVPQSLIHYGESTFEKVSDLFMLWGERGSMAHVLAGSYGTPFGVREECVVEENETGWTLLSYTTTDAQGEPLECAIMPSVVDGRPVTRLANLRQEDTVPVESSVVVTPLTLESLASHAFGYPYYENLAEVVLGPNITCIEEDAFFMRSVRNVNFPDGLVEIGAHAFSSSLLENSLFPDTLKSIGDSAFYRTLLQRIELPSSLSSLGKGAFSGCDELTFVSLSPSMKQIEAETFADCTLLNQIVIPQGIVSIGENAFYNCRSLPIVILPEGVQTIGEFAFGNCVSLCYVVIPPSVEHIAESAFYGCYSKLIICGQKGSISERFAHANDIPFEDIATWNAFPDPNQPDTIVLWTEMNSPDLVCAPFDPQSGQLVRQVVWDNHRNPMPQDGFFVPYSLNSIQLPSSLESVGADAFMGSFDLEQVKLPERLSYIGDGAFAHIDAMTQISLPNRLISIGSSAFLCSGLTQVDIPDSVISIGAGAFEDCTSLCDVQLSKGLSHLAERLFSYARIERIVIPSNIKTMSSAFADCSALTEVMLEEGLLGMQGSFEGCSALREITLPASLQRVGAYTFAGCEELEHVWFLNKDTEIEGVLEQENLVFSGCPDLTIHGWEGSTAQQYAKQFGIAFELITQL